MDKISIIVPIYKIADCVMPCIESILNQTYTNLEIILVDDGSPDNCGEICDEYAKKDSCIKVIHKKNGGLSDARNAGIEIATGKYLGFVDGDDTIEPRMYEVLHDTLVKNDAEISICSFRYVGGKEHRNKEHRNNLIEITDEVISGRDVLFKKRVSINGWGWGFAWNKLYRKEIFATLRYPVGKVYEDDFIVHKLFWDVKKVACTSFVGYNYIQRSTSVTNSFKINRLDEFESKLDREEFYREKNVSLNIRFINFWRCYYVLFDVYENADFRHEPFASKLKIIKKDLRRRNAGFMKAKLPLRDKAMLLGAYISPYLTWKLKPIIKIFF